MHNFDANDKEACPIWDTVQEAKAFRQMTDGMKYFLGAVGIVTLFLGGLGVMNVMMVAVRERTEMPPDFFQALYLIWHWRASLVAATRRFSPTFGERQFRRRRRVIGAVGWVEPTGGANARSMTGSAKPTLSGGRKDGGLCLRFTDPTNPG